ncbi:MAG: CDP-alcohol phosphatidyltransferase family protein [Acetobacteraceae bacterium]|nr:CDP-alcohol phosphatidyltransferase family protein [Acetobacteraceae bacterium]
MAVGSWSHRLVRPFVRPLARTAVTPNQLTCLRAITGVLACLCFAWGSRDGQVWGGVIWLLSALLDRADGELARIANRSSPAGHRYDYAVDMSLNASMFAAVGVGLRHSSLGLWAILLGLVCCVCLFLCLYWSEEIENTLEPGAVVLGGAGGFDPDDLFYLIGPLACAGLLRFVLLAGSIVLVPAAAVIGAWFWRARREVRFNRRLRVNGQTRNV